MTGWYDRDMMMFWDDEMQGYICPEESFFDTTIGSITVFLN